MRIVLTRTIIGIAIAILINALVYANIQNETTKEILVMVTAISFCCATPIIIGYISFYSLCVRYTHIAYGLTGILFVFNTLLLIAAPLLILFFAQYFLVSLLAFSYLAVAYYVFYETVNDTGNTKGNKTSINDVLDDNL